MKKFFLFLLVWSFAAQVFASSFKEIVFFGDSLTDNGNLYKVLKIPRSPPYYHGRFSNGPTWAEQLGDFYYKKLNAKNLNFAVGGATVIKRRVTDGSLPYYLKLELEAYLKNNAPTDDTLFVMWIGGNDYLDNKKQEPDALVTEVVNEIQKNIQTLIDKGAKQFFILDLPDLSKTPHGLQQKDEAKKRLLTLTELHHDKLLNAVKSLRIENPSIKFGFFDTYHLFDDVISNIAYYNEKYHQHFSNTTEACLPGLLFSERTPTALAVTEESTLAYARGKTPCDTPDSYIFWGSIHPSAAMHHVFAEILREKILAAS